MTRVSVVGNAGGGKSTLARRLGERHGLPCHEVDALLWRPDWEPAPEADYEAAHEALIEGERWVIDGLGRLESLPRRLERSTEIVFVDLPLWQHFWLAAERQIAWARGELEHRPGGAEVMPPTERLFRAIWTLDREWMPRVRTLVEARETAGARVFRIDTVEDLGNPMH